MKKEITYRVEGLDCAEEVAILRKEVGRCAGVLRLNFDVINARMLVEYDPARLSPEEIVAAVSAGGMRAVPWDERVCPKRGGFWEERGRLIMTSAAAVLLLAGLLVHWVMHGDLLHALDIVGRPAGHTYPPVVIALYALAIVAGAWYVLPKALISARELRPDMNLLMTIAVIGAVALGEWLEAGMVAFLFALSLLLEQWSVGRARRAIAALMDLAPPTARCLESDGVVRERPLAEVQPGAMVVVQPGERVPLDGVVARGETTIDQAPITGESVPVARRPGDEVYAGTINADGAIEVRVTKRAEDTTLARIIHMVSEAHERRAPSEQWVEKFARYYTPIMIGVALLIFLVPPLAFSQPWSDWLYRALVTLVIACPCALVISTPVSIVSGLTTAARHGVLIKGGIHLEQAGHLDVIAIDKTGTLTYGRPEVQQVAAFQGHSRELVLRKAAALESHSDHPLARAILRQAEQEGIAHDRAEAFRAVRGEGAEGVINGRLFWIGSHRMMDYKGQETPESHTRAEELEDAGHSVIALGNDEHVCGLISVADGVREGISGVVADLKSAGIKRVVMLTGDNEGTAAAVAAATGVDEYRSELLPQDKVSAVQALVRDYEHVAMVGDGVNDAPAMAASTMGIAMAAMGTDAAIETADVALMSDDLSKLPWLIRHSRRTLRIIQQNIFFALGLKAAFMALALLGVATLWMAIAADTGASLLVIFNALRLLRGGAAAPPEGGGKVSSRVPLPKVECTCCAGK